MSSPAPRLLRTQLASVTFAGASAVIASLWISICAAAPEFIWQGALITLGHLTREAILSGLLIGLVLAFFVDPVIERIRHLLLRARHGELTDDKPRNPLFTAGVALVFAFASVCLHDAMTAFVSGGSGGDTTNISGLDAGIELTTSWAIVPFFVTLAWLSARRRSVAIPTGIIAGASAFITGWLFSWTVQEALTTAIPGVLILSFGYSQVIKQPRRRAFIRAAQVVVVVASIWFALSLLHDSVFDFYSFDRLRLYNSSDFWVDVRFYCGWAVGLALAPFPPQRSNV